MLSPNNSEYSSHRVNSKSNHLIPQPQSNPQERFLNRSTQNCPPHLIRKQKTKWLKTGAKARKNQILLATTNAFHWSESHYDPPIYIHYRTPVQVLESLIETVTNIHLFTIDTELDKPTKQQPKPIPALIQIQAIREEDSAAVILIEVQHLPHRSTSLFRQIQQLCYIIFSNNNKIMAWGEVISELKPFQQFHLFDLSDIIDPYNIQKHFTRTWNQTHPHTSECSKQHRSIQDNKETDDCLICLVDTEDLNEEFDPTNFIDDYNNCICPDVIRPYKSKDAVWSLQQAVKHIFDQALDKTMTLNIWSCGLDPYLHTWNTNEDKQVRASLSSYAINDLFAPTKIFFHINKSSHSSQPSSLPPDLNVIMPTETINTPSFVILSDSHGKHLPATITTPNYQIITQSISGLQWVNPYNSNLCARSLISSSSLSSLLSSSIGVLFLIGTNSVRTTPALQIIEQIEDIINMIRLHHAHLSHKHDITIVTTFPCYKTSSRFPSTALLTSNIDYYNEQLHLSSDRMGFSQLNFNITEQHLHHDLMHLHLQHKNLPYDILIKYFNDLIIKKPQISQSQRRSRTAIARRNKKNHEKLKKKQKENTLIRPIHPIWKLSDIKELLKYHDINFARLPEIYKHQLRIQFNKDIYKQYAEQVLSSTAFDEQSCMEWRQRNH